MKKLKVDKELIPGITILVVFIVGLIVTCAIRKPSSSNYEFIITDMYSDIGSTFHVVGGRASETIYHVSYIYKSSNDSVWNEGHKLLKSYNYRKLKKGQKVYGHSHKFPYD